MSLVAAAVCPHPPLLLPAVGTGIELDVRAAARQAVERLVSSSPEIVVLVGPDHQSSEYASGDCGSLAGFGVDERVTLGSGISTREPALPLALTVGAWLLRQSGWSGESRAVGVPDQVARDVAVALGGRIASSRVRVAMLVMGDGSARRSEKAPGWFDPRAAPFDAAVAGALSAADLRALLALDDALARDLMAAGRAPWQVLAGAAAGQTWSAQLLADEAPFGVGYFVASWERVPPAPADVGVR